MNDAPVSPTNPTPTPAPTPAVTSTDPVSATGGTLAGAPAAVTPDPASATPPAPEPKADTPQGFTPADLALPEGLTADDPAVAQFVSEMNEAKVPKETSQKLLDQHYKAMQSAQEASVKLWQDTNKAWADAVRADPEIGGDKLTTTVLPVIKHVVDQFGGDQLRQALDITGAGNHPAVVKAFFKIGEALGESRNAVQGAPVTKPQPVLGPAAMYPHLANKGN